MLLDHALLTTPQAPAPLLRAVAARGVHEQLRGHLFAHPNAPSDLLDPSTLRARDLLQASTTPGSSTDRFLELAGGSSNSALAAALRCLPDAPAPVLVAFAARPDARGTHGVLTRRSARLLVRHPSTPLELHREAMLRLLATQVLSDRDRADLLGGALRHPRHLPELARACADRRLAQELAVWSTGTAPVRAYVDRAAARWTSTGWGPLMSRLPTAHVPQVAALGDLPVERVLSAAVPTAAREHILLAWLNGRGRGQALTGHMFAAAAPLIRSGSDELVRVLADTAQAAWELPAVGDLPNLSSQTLDALWDAARRVAPSWPRWSAGYGFGLACHEHASPRLRATVSDAIVTFACSSQADQSGWFRPGQALTTLVDIERHGRTHAGLALPVVAAGHRRGMSMAVPLTPLTRAALTHLTSVLDDPARALAFDTLSEHFPGTLADLATAAAAVGA